MRIQYRNMIGSCSTTVATQPQSKVTDRPRFGGGHSTTAHSYKPDAWHFGANRRPVTTSRTRAATAFREDRHVSRWCDAAAFPTLRGGTGGSTEVPWTAPTSWLTIHESAPNARAQRGVPPMRDCRIRSRPDVPPVLARDRPSPVVFSALPLLDGSLLEPTRSARSAGEDESVDLHHPLDCVCSLNCRDD
jgi:hypothetical protein